MEREIIEFTDREEISGIVSGWGPEDEWNIISNMMVDRSRWSIIHEVVLQRKSDGKYFWTYYSEGATESQDHRMYEYDEMLFKEVVPMEKTFIVYGWPNGK